jgi:dihydroorotase
MRSGDIFTHCFAELPGREPIVSKDSGKLKSFIWEAKKKQGIIFDVGAGQISLAYSQAIPAIQAGFYPNSISTDLHASASPREGILTIMSKFLALGMDIREVIGAVTWSPASEINHQELGNISVGTVADIAILSVQHGNFTFRDYTGRKIYGTKSFSCETTIRAGNIEYHQN